jgi:hypothetical protein
MTTQAFNLSQFANYVNSSGQVSTAGLQSGVVLPSGTVSLYYQASAPSGWSQVTSYNDYALRIVSGTGGGTGGTTAFSTVFTNQTPTISGGVLSGSVGATTLTLAQIPSHSHGLPFNGPGNQIMGSWSDGQGGYNPATTNNEGGGGSHTHSFSGSVSAITSSAITLNVRYVNIIICSKN